MRWQEKSNFQPPTMSERLARSTVRRKNHMTWPIVSGWQKPFRNVLSSNAELWPVWKARVPGWWHMVPQYKAKCHRARNFVIFYVTATTLPPPTRRKNVMVVPKPSTYITHLSPRIADSSLNVIMKYMTIPPNSWNVTFHQTVSVANPSPTRIIVDLTKRYITEKEKRILGETF